MNSKRASFRLRAARLSGGRAKLEPGSTRQQGIEHGQLDSCGSESQPGVSVDAATSSTYLNGL